MLEKHLEDYPGEDVPLDNLFECYMHSPSLNWAKGRKNTLGSALEKFLERAKGSTFEFIPWEYPREGLALALADATYNGYEVLSSLMLDSLNNKLAGEILLVSTQLAGPGGFEQYKSLFHALIEEGVDPNMRDESGRTLLMAIAAKEDISDEKNDLLRLMIEKGADVHAKDRDRNTALTFAFMNLDVEAVRLLVSKGANINTKDKWGKTPFIEFMGTKYSRYELDQLSSPDGRERNLDKEISLIKEMVSLGADPNARWGGRTLLSKDAVEYAPSITQLQIFLKAGCDPNARDSNGWTPLMRIALRDYDRDEDREAILILLNAGADVNVRDRKGNSALDLALQEGRDKMVTFLLESGASIDVRAANKGRLLCYAAEKGDIDIMKSLLGQGVSANSIDTLDKSALMRAAEGSCHECAEMLLKKGAKMDHASEYGWTALAMAVYSGDTGIARLLIDHGADVNARFALSERENVSFLGYLWIIRPL